MLKSKKTQIDPNSTDTLIGAGTSIEGNLTSEAGIRIEGKIVGQIECTGDVTIGEGAFAKSNINARSVIIAGKVEGNVQTKGLLKILSTGQLYGDIQASQLYIEEGGIFSGNSKMAPPHSKQEDAGKNKSTA